MDGNKRTALNTTAVFYTLNGYRFDYDEAVRGILKQFGTDEATVEETNVVDYLRSHTEQVGVEQLVSEWRDDLVAHGMDELTGDSTHQND